MDGSWNLYLFHFWVSKEVISRIVSVPPPHLASGLDKIIWGFFSTGSFSLKNTYEKVREGSLNPKEPIWELLWKFKRIRSDSACGFCGCESEEVLHVLRDCLAARSIWDKIVLDETLFNFYIRSFQEWITGISWSIDNVLKVSLTWARQYTSAFMTSTLKGHRSFDNSFMEECWVCLNTDGLERQDEGFTVAGGLVRDQNGRWIMGFNRYLRNCTVTKSKLWGILDGIKLILDRRFERILIQIDSLEAMNTIQEGVFRISNSTLLRRIHQFLTKVKQWKIQHIPREQNTVADSLVKMICDRKPGLRLFEDPPLRV
ncbi:hypothetical protein Godav_019703 [Gossypium davidsonii]|uniref:RNase H type-1 domain-containing protein n=1 Tax=Gossypium davidsonii TaxID=34287 RepID=A0A7J8R0W8_GOSDV|nr:hypothetical protein [Gossypium davidsonii]